MATELPGYKHTGYTASSDLSSSRFRAVKISGARTVTAIAAITDKPFGVLQNAPASGQVAEVMAQGRSKMEASAAIAVGATIGVSANGRAVTIAPGTDLTQYIIGIAEDACSNAGEIISVYLTGGHGRAT